MKWKDGMYEGTITSVKPRKKQFLVKYDDGDEFWEDYDPLLKELITSE